MDAYRRLPAKQQEVFYADKHRIRKEIMHL